MLRIIKKISLNSMPAISHSSYRDWTSTTAPHSYQLQPQPCHPWKEGGEEGCVAVPGELQDRSHKYSNTSYWNSHFKTETSCQLEPKKKKPPQNMKKPTWKPVTDTNQTGIMTNSEISSRSQCLPFTVPHINTQSFLPTSMAASNELSSLRYFTRLKS